MAPFHLFCDPQVLSHNTTELFSQDGAGPDRMGGGGGGGEGCGGGGGGMALVAGQLKKKYFSCGFPNIA